MTNLQKLTPAQLQAALDELQAAAKKEGCRLYRPYAKQKEFHAAGAHYREVMFAAGNQCISPWTLVQTPDSTVPAGNMLFSAGQSVLSWDGEKERIAGTREWFLRGIAPVFRVLLDTGRWFDCSAAHQVATPDGWLSVAQLVLRAGGLRYWRTHADLTASCATDGYRCGPLLPPGQGSGQDLSRTSGGAPGRSLCWTREDAWARIPERIRACLASGHLTISDGDRPYYADLFAQFSAPACESPVLLSSGDIQAHRRRLSELACGLRSGGAVAPHPESRPELSILAAAPGAACSSEPSGTASQEGQQSPSLSGLVHAMHEAVLGAAQAAIYIPWEPLNLVGGASILALVPLGYQPLIDTQVPDLHNYKAAGVYHHNCGKSYSAAAELAIHLTGEYPDWWEGRVWDRPIHAWAAGVTGESTRDTLQRLLMGRPGEFGSGTIPADMIVSYTSGRGVADSLDTVVIKHRKGGTSTLGFKSYALGREKWQGSTLDLVAFDEEPPMEIWVEGLTRTNATYGRAWLTFTPLLGYSEVVRKFFEEASPDRKLVQATIDDAEHYTPEQRARIIASYPAHEREARAKGIPTLGSGRVFPIAEEDILVPAFPIPKHWPRLIGLDLGYDHPAAAVWIAWDRDTDTIYLTDCFRIRESTPAIQAPMLAAKGKWLPVAWPHDALQHDKGSGEVLAQQYRELGVNMLPERATFEDGSNGVEAGVMEMLLRMQTGRWKVFSHLLDWVQEFRLYHRKDGKINKINDDLISASRYAMMMKRFAVTEPAAIKGKVYSVNFKARKGGY